MKIKRRIEGLRMRSGRWCLEMVKREYPMEFFFFVVGDPPDGEFIRSGDLSQQSVFGTNVVTYGNGR